jgi:hypothetical protein
MRVGDLDQRAGAVSAFTRPVKSTSSGPLTGVVGELSAVA